MPRPQEVAVCLLSIHRHGAIAGTPSQAIGYNLTIRLAHPAIKLRDVSRLELRCERNGIFGSGVSKNPFDWTPETNLQQNDSQTVDIKFSPVASRWEVSWVR